jgi:hypothetical protein
VFDSSDIDDVDSCVNLVEWEDDRTDRVEVNDATYGLTRRRLAGTVAQWPLNL